MTALQLILILFTSFLIPELSAHFNFWIIQYGKINPNTDTYKARKMWHRWQAVVRCAIYGIILIFAWGVDVSNWLQAVEILIIFSVTFFHWFDGRLNNLFHRSWFYRGNTSDIDKLIYSFHWPAKIVSAWFGLVAWIDLIFGLWV